MENEEQLYTIGIGDEILGYAYGEEWVAMALYMDDWPKFSTPEEAKDYWRKYKERSGA